jgi:hypothetical protein
MAIDGTLSTLQFGGRLYTDEEWSCSLHLHGPTPAATGGGGSTFNPAEQYAAPLKAWFEAPLSYHSGGAYLDFVKFNDIDPTTARYASTTDSNTYLYPSIQPYGRGQTNIPQGTVAISLGTALQRGPASKGRFYPPGGWNGLTNDGRALPSEMASKAALVKTLINDLNAAQGAGGQRVVVYSKQYQSVRAVTHIRVGRVVDTQRRRRSSLAEEYQTVPLA